MAQKYIPRLLVIVLGTLIIFSAANAIAASNTVSGSRLDELTNAITINDKKPPQCTMNLTGIVVCTGGNCDGTNQSELILGTPGGERIRGRGGQDCILGGDGNDDLQGNGGGDVCFGGPGTDTFTTCETVFDP